jgi:hypothetical protein
MPPPIPKAPESFGHHPPSGIQPDTAPNSTTDLSIATDPSFRFSSIPMPKRHTLNPLPIAPNIPLHVKKGHNSTSDPAFG